MSDSARADRSELRRDLAEAATGREGGRHTASALVIGLALFVLSGCQPSGPLQVSTIQLGRSLNPDNSVAAHATTFNRSDTVYVSILTANAGSGTIGVKWTYQGRTIDEPQRPVSYREAAATEFHLVNSNGFPEGQYSVEVFVDGRSVGTRNFNVN